MFALGGLYVLTHKPKVELGDKRGPKPKPGSRTSGPEECPYLVLPYGQLSKICNKLCGGEAHHIVPDFTKRWVGRELGKGEYGRVDHLAKYNDGASICLQGGAADDGSEHWEAHGADPRIEALGKHPDSPFFPAGTARIDDIRDVSEQQVKEIRQECAAQIAIGVSNEFKNVDPNTLGRVDGFVFWDSHKA